MEARSPILSDARSNVVHARRLGSFFAGGREFLGNHFVYLFFSARAGGLTVGVNLNPDRRCNFDCIYCEVNRHRASTNGRFDVDLMAQELVSMLERVRLGQLREIPCLRNLPPELLELRHVAVSGEGEPTLCPAFAEAMQAIVHVRATGQVPFFKIALLTNASLLDQAHVQAGLRCLILRDELWLKLDAGTAEFFARVNRPEVSYARVLGNILHVAQQRPVIIQSLFPLLEGREPSEEELIAYAARLCQLKKQGAQISLVQVYSATRPTVRSDCRHLSLKSLSRIAQFVRSETGLAVQVA